MISTFIVAIATLAILTGDVFPAAAQTIPDDYQAVLGTLGRTGDFKDGVLKVGIPRDDLHVTIAGRPLPTAFGFGGWVAFTRGDGGMDVMMGDLVLTEDEVPTRLSPCGQRARGDGAPQSVLSWISSASISCTCMDEGKPTHSRTSEAGSRLMAGGSRNARPPQTCAERERGTLDTAALTTIAAMMVRQGTGTRVQITIGRSRS